MESKKNEIKVSVPSVTMGLHMSPINTKQVVSATNNRAQYYADLAKKYRDEAKQHRDNAKYYAEQNADVTYEYIDSIRAMLENKISTKQPTGDYALKEDLPINVSELKNDAQYIDKTKFDAAVEELSLPSQTGAAGCFLMSDGANETWIDAKVLSESQITNCLLEVPQRIKLELVDGVLTLKKGSIIVFPRGTEDKTSQYVIGKEFNNSKFKIVDRVFKDNKFFVWVELQTDITDSGLDTSGNIINRCVSLNPSGTMIEMGVSQSGNIEYSGTGNCTTYRTDLNLIQYHYSGVLQNYNGSLPIATVISDGVSQVYGSIDQIFNGFGYIGNTIFCDKGVKALIPNGRNEDGTLKNIEITTDSVLSDTRNIKSSTFKLVLNASSFSNWQAADYDFERNYNTNATGGNIGRAVVGSCETDANGAIINFEPNQSFRAVDWDDFKESINTLSKAYIIETYVSFRSGYIVYSNGYCEQWGVATLSNNDSINEVTLLKPYKNAYYLVIANGHSGVATNTGGVDVFHTAPITNSVFNITWDYASKNQLNMANWIARGYIS